MLDDGKQTEMIVFDDGRYGDGRYGFRYVLGLDNYRETSYLFSTLQEAKHQAILTYIKKIYPELMVTWEEWIQFVGYW